MPRLIDARRSRRGWMVAVVVLLTACAAWAATPAASAVAADSPGASDQSQAQRLRVSPDLRELLEIPELGRKLETMLVLFQLAALLTAAKLLGAAAERIGVPGVIGELLAGAIIGPYLLGRWIHLPLHGHWVQLFPPPATAAEWPISEILWSIAQFASVVLLFVTGLHTDLRQFMRYVGPATLIALAGVAAPFALGVGVVYIPAFADLARGAPGESALVAALFVGAILAATSIGITARVLSDIEQLDSPEGVTILGAAVLDDVLGIIALAVVGGIAATGTVSLGSVGWITAKALGVWVGLTVIILLLARPIERLLTSIPYSGAMVGLGLALAFVASGVAEFFGLAFIIGAYSAGLGLSRTRMAGSLMHMLQPISDFIVPIFFATLGMLVDFQAMLSDRRVIVFGLAVTVAAIIGKLAGCGLAALPAGFNARGAYRVGLGMLPRGEVALIVAGVGLSQNIIGPNVFGVSIMMTLLTTIIAPIMLVRAFQHGGSGRKRPDEPARGLPGVDDDTYAELLVPPDLGEAVVGRLLRLAEERGWQYSYQRTDVEFFLLRNGPDAAQVRLADGRLRVDSDARRQREFADLLAAVQQSIRQDMERAAAAQSARQ